MEIQRQIHHILLGILDRGSWLDFVQAVAEEPDAIDEQPVGMPLDFKIAEECVCAEQRDDLVENIVAFAIRVGRLVGRQRLRRLGQRVGGAADLCAQRQDWDVSNQPGIGVRVED